MTTEDRDEKDGPDPQADVALWALLGRQEPSARVSPYFSRRVLREVAALEARRAAGWSARWRRLLPPNVFSRQTAAWSGVLSGACAVALFCVSHMLETPKISPTAGDDGTKTAITQVAPEVARTIDADGVKADDGSIPVQEVEVIADLDNILQREESRLWTDDTTTSTARF